MSPVEMKKDVRLCRLFSSAFQICLFGFVHFTYFRTEENEDYKDGAKNDQHHVHGGI